MTDEFYFVGDTGVHYTTEIENGVATTTFTGFVTTENGQITGADNFSDPFDMGVDVAVPYDFIPHTWTHTYEAPDAWF
ncbi:hypothetical protein [Roseovarius pacificus]|uniref:hypothetical protein n=1 Tax=Roseovarius pacificus TaxID=337701 RepID=UPI0011609B4C|nr:hypothetical protein [Roseovarius pacificus]GGO61133.1 hypothetical protein GCM10011315_37140 [Roseovarius pacificus]